MCYCSGEVVEMRGQIGWLKVYGDVHHPLAEKHGGHIFLTKQDVAGGNQLVAGDIVTFYLYADAKGLGAEVCQLQKSASYGAVAQECWSGNSSWGNRQVQLQNQVVSQSQQQHMYYAPHGLGMPGPSGTQVPQEHVNSPAINEKPTEVADGALPSVGSVGHADGSCKRCAFFPKGRCQNGADCTHCHFDHTNRLRLRKRRPAGGRLRQTDGQESRLPEMVPSNNTQESDDEDHESEVPASIGSAKVNDVQSVDIDTDSSMQPIEEQDTRGGGHPVEDDGVDTATKGSASSSGSDDEGSSLDSNAQRVGTVIDFLMHHAKEQQQQGGDSTSEDDVETRGPSSHSASDDEGVSPVSPRSEGASSRGRTASFHQEQEPTSPVSPRSPTSWSEQRRIRKAAAAGLNNDVSTAEIAHMARALLNKLTHERFESLCGQILALPFSTSEQLAVLVAEIFEKATTQDGFRALYTELCVRLDTHLVEKDSVVGGKAFRKALVNECQATFERHLQPADPSLFIGLTGEECFEVEMKLKTRRLGNMRFIGDLLVRRLLAQKLMPPIVLELLNGDEAALESLIAFLMVIAPFFEQNATLYKAPLRDAFATLRHKRTEKGISSRVRCLMSDLFDARARGWAPRSA